MNDKNLAQFEEWRSNQSGVTVFKQRTSESDIGDGGGRGGGGRGGGGDGGLGGLGEGVTVGMVSDGTSCNEDRLGAVGCIRLAVEHFRLHDDDVMVIAGYVYGIWYGMA